MKRTILALLIFFLCTEYGQAQIADTHSLTVAGNYTAVYSTDRRAVRTPLNGMELGYLGEKEILDGMLFSTGARISLVRYGTDDLGASSVFYLSVPLDVKIMFPLNLYTKAGLRMDFKTIYHSAKRPAVINGHDSYQFDGFAMTSEFFLPGWSIGIGREFDINGLKPWIEIRYGGDFKYYVDYGSIISMKKNTGTVRIGIPISRW